MMNHMAMELRNGVMETYIRDSLNRVLSKEEEFICGVMNQNIKGIGFKERYKVKENLNTMMVEDMREIGRII